MYDVQICSFNFMLVVSSRHNPEVVHSWAPGKSPARPAQIPAGALAPGIWGQDSKGCLRLQPCEP